MKDKSSLGIPLRPAEKLKQIRTSLGLSQKEISTRLEYKNFRITRSTVSNYELGKSGPPLIILFAYANLATISMDVLADDALDLPDTIAE
jgi:transcriptional regulator with XRE-family HTH domain